MSAIPEPDHAHRFGSHAVAPEERDQRMRETFRRLAPHYDRLLDVQTLGLHRHWRRVLTRAVAPRPGERILDVAGGCGEMALRLAGRDHRTIVIEPSLPMMEIGRARARGGGRGDGAVDWVAALARALPLADGSVDKIVCAFGLRNVTYIEAGLAEALRVLRPGGRLYCLEVSRPPWPVRPLYGAFCRHVVPHLGSWVTRVPEAFDYLADSLVTFPDRATVTRLFEEAGFVAVTSRCLTLGIVCLHIGTKPE